MAAEWVYTIEETYHGLPKKGVADFGGVAHRFAMLGLESFDWTQPEWYFEDRAPDHDLYELVPVAEPSKPKIVRHGHFSDRKDAIEWKPLSIQERLDRIGGAQRGAGEEFGLPKYTPFMVGSFYLNDVDLNEIRPLLKDDPEKPNVGQIGRYEGVAVFPLSARPALPSVEELPIAEYEGVFYGYCEMDHVFG
jgi:hypothetical protein